MPTGTPPDLTRIAAEALPSGVRLRSAGGAFRVMTLRRGTDGVRVALVPDRALLLAGDRVRLEIEVGAGVDLEVVETAGTVAYDMRGGSASWDLDVRVADGASCRWEGLPFVVAAGADVDRSLTVDLAGGGTFIQRETLVLGRYAEPPGRLRAATGIRRDGRPVLLEQLDGAHLAPYRVLDTILHTGPVPAVEHAPAPAVVRLDLSAGGTCWRSVAHEAHDAAAHLDRIWRAAAAPSGGTGQAAWEPDLADLASSYSRRRSATASGLPRNRRTL